MCIRDRSWLTSNNEDFKTICENAGRDAKYVKEKIKRIILKAEGWNVKFNMRVTSPRRRKQMKEINKQHLTGNDYYAAKRTSA